MRSAWDAERKQFLSQTASLKEKLGDEVRQTKEVDVQKREEEAAGLRMGRESPLDQEEDGYYSEWAGEEVNCSMVHLIDFTQCTYWIYSIPFSTTCPHFNFRLQAF